jgi:hypothetical protein
MASKKRTKRLSKKEVKAYLAALRKEADDFAKALAERHK